MEIFAGKLASDVRAYKETSVPLTFSQVFIVILASGSVLYWLWVPETRAVPLEELAVIFGDSDEVKVLSKDIFLDENREVVVEHHSTEQGDMVKEHPVVALHEKV